MQKIVNPTSSLLLCNIVLRFAIYSSFSTWKHRITDTDWRHFNYLFCQECTDGFCFVFYLITIFQAYGSSKTFLLQHMCMSYVLIYLKLKKQFGTHIAIT